MIFFGSLLRSPHPYSEYSSFRALLHVAIERLCQRYKLALSLAVCLCLVAPVHASHPDVLLEAKIPKVSVATDNKLNDNSAAIDTSYNEDTLTIENVKNINGLAPASLWQPELSEPSLYALLDAEFAADRDDKRRAVSIYKQQSFKEDATAVFERALSLSLRNERVEDSLQFAKTWQDQNPDHVPAWFYVAHLALRAHDYILAGETLNRILRYDPRADLSEILIGIYPNNDEDKRELLAALQPLDSEQNASLSVLKAGLLYQFNEPEVAIVHINRALERQPDYVPFITLKADILRKIVTAETVINYVSQARLRNPDSKSLYLYEIRYLLDLKQSEQAWKLLLEAHSRFNDDSEITLLAALVSLDIEEYASADELLNMLAKSPAYLDQAYYYLGISAERQQLFDQAKYYLNGVMQEDLVLEARRKVVAFELLDNDVDAAIATLEKLRKDFTVFAPDTFVMQADILWQQNESDEALRLLTRAARKYPDNEMLLFARAQLLDDKEDYVVKRTLLNHLQALDPSNLSYQLSYAQLLLANERSSEQGLALATAIIQIRYDDPRYDNDLHLQALNVLAGNALAKENYQQVIDYLQTPYDVLPTLRSGTLLLRAYQGLGNNDKVEALLADLQQRFSFGQHNINDRIQLY
ncbi:tetratricopeptide repeat protein [uncultured Psychrobacter sp.]|uniref:tetratricopeptide repeat protein n=1 Tax=uncultured Psychrobacter sp. TaxID=259303 RepID=UPI00260B7BA9|nr:tetratricopeptide repeat protein [uncultured Psychrobacter sp.]